jgi:hypothetical protein
MRRDHQHRPVLHLGLLLQKPIGLCCQAVVEARIGVHLHLQEHYRELRTAGFGAARALARPQNPSEAVAELFDLKGLKAVEPIARSTWVEVQRGDRGIRTRQEDADQVGGALENPLVPAVGIHWLRAPVGER